jgi:putative heme-binding domain-containing protein
MRGQHIAADRQQVFNDYRDASLGGGDAKSGRAIFEKNCASCHQLGNVGNAIGPNLISMISRGAESVLFNILAPNGEVDPRYLEYSIVTADGQILPGVIAGETSTAVTLRGADNKLTTVLRVDIDEMRNTGKSLMPEGFEKTIDKSSMADLITFLQNFCSAALLLCCSLVPTNCPSVAFAVDLQVSTFNVDITPPIGSPLCDGLVPPVKGVDSPLTARGIILKADEQPPVVLVALDWVGIGNEPGVRRSRRRATRRTIGYVCTRFTSMTRPVATF